MIGMHGSKRAAKVVALVCVAGAFGCERRESPEKAVAPTPPPAAAAVPTATPAQVALLSEFNRGAGLLEQYRYVDAAEAFQKVLERAPDWTAARFNLGVAMLNIQKDDEDEKEGEARGVEKYLEIARASFEAVLAAEPGHLPARFCLGLLHQHLGENDTALACFAAVQKADPGDAYVAYKCAEALLTAGRDDEGRAMLEKVVELDGGFVSGVYRLAQIYQRMRQPQKAAPLFVRFKALNEAELTAGSFVVQKQYGSAGKYYMALGADNLPLRPPEPPARRIVFSPEVRKLPLPVPPPGAGGERPVAGIAAGDIDGDGDLDLCIARPGGATLLVGDGRGSFSAGAALAPNGIAPCLGDIDNDGDLDLWLGCDGPDRLFENDGKGAFKELAIAGAAGPAAPTFAARLLDADSDGDLDLLAVRSEPAATNIYQNNRDGTFVPLPGTLGESIAKGPLDFVVADDFDGDRDLDCIGFTRAGGATVWVNDRLGVYRSIGAAAAGLTLSGVVAATTGDPDKDGDRDLLVATGERLHLLCNAGGMRFTEDEDFANRFGPRGGTSLQFADMDNDGDLDIVIADAGRQGGNRGPSLLVNDWPRRAFRDAVEIDPGNLLAALRTGGPRSSCIAADVTGDGRCDLVLVPGEGEASVVENATQGGHWIEIDLRGTRDSDHKTRSNGSAIGARVEVKAGGLLQQFVVGEPAGPAAMPPPRIHAGLGDNPSVDWLRIVWPDGVLQAELELPGDRVTAVEELQRKTSSCPLLFAWTGERFEFVADFGGVGGLGYLVSPGTFAAPDPTEYIRLPGLAARDGAYVLQVLGQLEEVVYLDEAKLIAVDHAVGTEVLPNEMMAVGAPPPAFEIFCFAEPIEPVRAVDHRGSDVTAEVRAIDRRYAGATEPDGRFIGLAREHWVELDFGDRLARLEPAARLVLVLAGWVDYGYSSTNFAASQAGLAARAPTISVRRADAWVEVFKEVGYPAGINHTMTLDVTGKVLSTDRRIRIASTMELFWDRIFLAEHRGGAIVSVKEAPATSADLHARGYPREYSPDGRQPNLYDYDNVDAVAAWKLMDGAYTRFGDVAALVAAADDRFAIMGHGEEITLRFDPGAFGPLPEGKRRTFILKTDSYCKDMDLLTAHADTVEPLPFHRMTSYPYGPGESYPDDEASRAYRRTYNTRLVRTR